MNLLIVSRKYYPEVIGGGQISAHFIAQALVNAGVTVRVLTFTTEGTRKDELLDGVNVTRLPIRTLKLFPRISNVEWMYREMKLQTLHFLKEFRPDVIHALNGESVPSIAAVSRITGIPFVATVNGPTLFCFTQEGTDSKGNHCFGCKGRQRFNETMLKWGQGSLINKAKAFGFWLYSYPHMYLLKKSCLAAKQLLCVSSGVKSTLLSIGYPERLLTVVHNPIETHTKVKSTIKKKLGIPASDKILFFAGRITINKGVQNMVAALPSLPKTHVVIAGKGDYIQEITELAARLDVSERVHFVGFVSNEALGQYYSIADIVIMAGTFFESLGRMLLEACSYGVPVIATNYAGNPDVIEDGKNGFLLQTQNVAELCKKVKRILAAPKLAAQMGKYGKQKMRHEFSPEAVAKELTQVYENVCTENRA